MNRRFAHVVYLICFKRKMTFLLSIFLLLSLQNNLRSYLYRGIHFVMKKNEILLTFVIRISVPTAPPSKFTALSTTNDTVTLQWRQIPYLSKHGVIQRFVANASGRLANGTLHTKEPLNFTESAADSNTAVFTFDFGGLFPYTVYNFTLVGCTEVGCGPSTEVYDIQTKQMGMYVLRGKMFCLFLN